MSQAHGEWLRQLRQARGWSIAQMVRELREAAASAGDKLPDRESMIGMIHRWESDRSGISERYRRHYSTAFKTPINHFGDPSILDALHANGISQIGTGHIGESRPRSARDRMQASLSQVGDPAKRDQMCFQLGYLCALMVTAAPAHAPSHPVLPAPADQGDQT